MPTNDQPIDILIHREVRCRNGKTTSPLIAVGRECHVGPRVQQELKRLLDSENHRDIGRKVVAIHLDELCITRRPKYTQLIDAYGAGTYRYWAGGTRRALRAG